jgi:hypothetical protein
MLSLYLLQMNQQNDGAQKYKIASKVQTELFGGTSNPMYPKWDTDQGRRLGTHANHWNHEQSTTRGTIVGDW